MSLITANQLKDQSNEGGIGGIWAKLKQQLEFAQYRPKTVDNVEVSKLSGRQGVYYVLRNSKGEKYYRLDEQDYFLWAQMDGSRTVKDLVVSYFTQYGSFAFARVGSLVQGLKAGDFLVGHPAQVYGQVEQALARQQTSFRLQNALSIFTGKPLALDNIDDTLDVIYRGGAWLLFTKPVQILLIVLIIVGMMLFAGFVRSGDYSLAYTGGSLILGIIVLFALNLFSIFLHELSHALTVKHFGRRVRSGGFLLYYGMPAFFVDTTDIWMQHKKARLAVTWAGPHGSLVVAALAVILMVVSPWPTVDNLLYIIAFVTYVNVFFNLNPLLELDGYFLLMDWLEIPMLRAKSLGFVRTGVWSKFRHAAEDSGSRIRTFFSMGFWAALSREERLFTVFGLLSAAWSVIAIVLSIRYWQHRLSDWVAQIWTSGNTIARIALALVGLAVILTVVLVLARIARPYALRFAHWMKQKGVFASTWRIAAILLAVSVLLAWILTLLSEPFLAQAISAFALVLGGVWAWQNGRYIHGARSSRSFIFLTIFMAALFVSILLLSADMLTGATVAVISIAQRLAMLIASLAALLGSFVLLSVDSFKAKSRTEQGILILGILGAFLIVFFWNNGSTPVTFSGWLEPSITLFLLLAVVFILPTIASAWHNAFAPTWLILVIAFCLLASGTRFQAASALACLLAAAAMNLYRTAFDRVDYKPERENTAYFANEQALLTQAYRRTFDGLVAQHKAITGSHQSQRLLRQFNEQCLGTNWMTRFVADQIESNLPEDIPLPERGRRYGGALSLFLDLTKLDIGEIPAASVLKRSYDALSWEQREIASIYIISQIDQARSLSRQLQNQRSDQTELLRQMPVLSAMSEEEIELVASRLTSRQLVAGEAFIKQGEPGDNLYVIRSGHVEISVQDEDGYVRVVNQLGRGSYVGEVALITDAPRNATCKATLPTEVLVLSRDDFVELVKDHFEMGEKVSHSIKMVGLLRRIPVFSGIENKTLQQLAAHLEPQEYESGSYIIRQGEIGDTFYIIESGHVEVLVRQDTVEKTVNQLGAGGFFGEIALLMNIPRTASVRTTTATVALAMHREEFERFVTNDLYANKVLELESSRRLHNKQGFAAPAPA